MIFLVQGCQFKKNKDSTIPKNFESNDTDTKTHGSFASQISVIVLSSAPCSRVAIWLFLKLFARNKIVLPFGHFWPFLSVEENSIF
jgi:hypothetical protein